MQNYQFNKPGKPMIKDKQIIAFDADDTLWATEDYFREAEKKFSKIINCHENHEETMKLHFESILQNMPIYGFGIKAFVLSSLEAAVKITKKQLSNEQMMAIINIGKEMLNAKVELLPEVENTLKKLKEHYQLVVLTKGDLLDQQRKLKESGLSCYFEHMEVMSDKKTKDYEILFRLFNINAREFTMIGNSLKSDVLPIVELGGCGIHIPYHTTWEYEQMDMNTIDQTKYHSLVSMSELPELLEKINRKKE